MLEKINDKIFRLQVIMPMNLGYANCYLVNGENGFTIVDTGDNTDDAKAVWEKLLKTGIKIEKVVVTHAHPDHLGLSGWFQRNYGFPVWLSEKGYEEVTRLRQTFDDNYENPAPSFLFSHGATYYHGDEDNEEPYYKLDTFQFEPDYLFKTGDFITIGDDEFEAIWTPGHCIDHHCYHNSKDGTIFTGDHILRSINPLIASSHEYSNPLKDYMASLDMIAGRKTGISLPGHGDIIVELPARITEKKEHYRKRWLQTYEAVGKEGKTAFEACHIVYGGIANNFILAPFMQTITNLIYLESIGYLKKELHGGKYYYSQQPAGKQLFEKKI